jgi:hypothetical protein
VESEPVHDTDNRGAPEETVGGVPVWKTDPAGTWATAAFADLALDLMFDAVPVIGMPVERVPFALVTERSRTKKISPREAGFVVTLCPLIAVTVP